MSVISNLEPKRVMKYFEDICAIPHGSGNSDRIAQYCEEFAKAHNFEYSRDASNNIIIKKEKHPLSKSSDTVIIQGHLDMVCAGENGCGIDFEKDGLRLCADDKYIWADKTSLGGDDGIAVAMALAILESDDIIHPPLECVFTTDEEIGMLGAEALDMSGLRGKYLLNLDSETEGEFTVSCAGGATLTAKLPVKRTRANGTTYKIEVDGLTSGHSGVEIDKGRANAMIVLGGVLKRIADEIEIISVNGGEKDNAIAQAAEAVVIADKLDLSDIEAEYKEKYRETDPGLSITVSECESECGAVENKTEIIELISSVPDGVREMSPFINGLVETSSNFGTLKTDKDNITATFSVRSSVLAKKIELLYIIGNIVINCGGTVDIDGAYPEWEFREISHLRDAVIDVFRSQYGEEPKLAAIHAGLECGVFCGKVPELDCISFGPNISDIHTPQEKLDIKSTERVYNFTVKLLESL